MIRQTSADAYRTIKEEGLLSERRWQVYDILYRHGPLTGNEVLKYLKTTYSIGSGNAPSIVSRLGELRNNGCAYEVRTRACSVTGMRVIEWDVTAKLPIKFSKPKRHKCIHCDGRGYHEEKQARLF